MQLNCIEKTYYHETTSLIQLHLIIINHDFICVSLYTLLLHFFHLLVCWFVLINDWLYVCAAVEIIISQVNSIACIPTILLNIIIFSTFNSNDFLKNFNPYVVNLCKNLLMGSNALFNTNTDGLMVIILLCYIYISMSRKYEWQKCKSTTILLSHAYVPIIPVLWLTITLLCDFHSVLERYKVENRFDILIFWLQFDVITYSFHHSMEKYTFEHVTKKVLLIVQDVGWLIIMFMSFHTFRICHQFMTFFGKYSTVDWSEIE